ncbi:hypothetical protein DCAR_0935034 [Daucus carota subsp. sativus]|uniref:IST1-like protein n=2 Tax=Daucus carota subsp. sativus TaxID=79200 RepID=A0AAF0XWC1_DAUCS|nr:PREDICTED: IST1 homolog [Daucus carota subsp. sativus]WOH15493.1 hypothetical protein DCAR_0935034 [Daucus carota subsp. sativus]
MLNQLFSRGLLGPKCKTCLTLAISRMKLLQNKRDVQLKLMRKEIAQFLQAGQESIARIRVEHVIREQNIWAAYEILEMFCEFILARVPILESQRECPSELREAVASIIFAAPRCSDIPDLLQVRNLFAAKYGKEFIAAASELRPDTSVNRTIIEKLSVSTPPGAIRLKVLKDIAQEHNVVWDSSKSEAEFSKKPEDLLNGPKPIAIGNLASEDQSKPDTRDTPSLLYSNMSLNNRHGNSESRSPKTSRNTSLVGQNGSQTSIKSPKIGPNTGFKEERGSQPSDVLQKAQEAIAAAERASASARAAAELVNVNFNTGKS